MKRQSGNGGGADDRDKTFSKEFEGSAFLGQRSATATVADVSIAAERVRVMLQVRLAHLARRGATCKHTEQLFKSANGFEDEVDRQLTELVANHPAAPWFTRVKGVGGGEVIGKVLGHIEAFGCFYEPGDIWIPGFVNRETVMVPTPTEKPDEFTPRPMIWVEGIERLMTPSKLRKYAGLLPDSKREAGKQAEFNGELRTMLWRLGTNLLKAQGKYASFYGSYKARLTARLISEGKKILPTPKGRFCPTCEKPVALKSALFCPDCRSKLAKKDEPENVYWQGHVHAMAMRRMIQLFSDHLWAVWREALNLPLREPYAIEYLGHSQIIHAEDMADRPKLTT